MSTNLSIKAVCKLTGLNEHTLRMWERRYNAIAPMRTDTRRRLYSPADVERLRILFELTRAGRRSERSPVMISASSKPC